MEYLKTDTKHVGTILCCHCGTPIEPNPANTCVPCLRTQVDITEGIPTEAVVQHCKKCNRYQSAGGHWVAAELESRELLSLCLKKIKARLQKVRLTDASFIWTEPHSKRLQVKLTVQKEIMNGAVMQQTVVCEFVVQGAQCDACARVEAKDFWRAKVQVRQKASHKKTLFYLEQLLLKHSALAHCLNVKPIGTGMDFYFGQKQDARKLVDFIINVLPCRYDESQQLVTHDCHNNTYQYKHTYSVEIVPICKDDVVCLPKQLAQALGSLGQLCVCTRVLQNVSLVDPSTGKTAEMSASQYWRYPFQPLCSTRGLVQYIILDCEPSEKQPMANMENEFGSAMSVASSQLTSRADVRASKLQQADCWVAKSSELGVVDTQYFTRTHLGRVLRIGDVALGFDLATANVNDDNFETMRHADQRPDVILVKKFFDPELRRQRRRFRLKHFNGANIHRSSSADTLVEPADDDYRAFLEDLEEDPKYRSNVEMFVDRRRKPTDLPDGPDDLPSVGLEEMLSELKLDSDQMDVA